jgi:hypothetical protein
MDIILNIIGLGFIPLLILMLAGGLNDIYRGLQEHLELNNVKITVLPVNFKSHDISEKFGFRKLNINFSKG